MKIKPEGKLILLSLFFAILACGALGYYLRQVKEEAAEQVSLQDVVVADQDIPANSELTEEMLGVRQMPKGSLPPNTINTISEAVGKITKIPLLQGELIYTHHLTKDRKEGGLAFQIPEGCRAMTVAVNEVTGVAKLVRPGNYVDVLVYCKMNDTPLEKILLQQKLVLAVDQKTIAETGNVSSKSGEKGEGKTITLSVTPSEAQLLGLAQEAGEIRLILRPQEEKEMFKGRAVTPKDMVGAAAAISAEQEGTE